MPTIINRAGWGAVPPKRRTLRDPDTLKGVTVHWFGSPKASSTHAGCDDLLRGVQRDHMAPGGLGVAKGGADIGYNHAVCPHGIVYELRGFGVQTGANGTEYANENYSAIVYMAGTGDPFTDAGKVGLNYWISEWRKRGTGNEVVAHRRWTGSTCPGPDILAWLAAGRPSPDTEEPDMDPRFPTWLRWYLFDRPLNKPRPASTDGLEITQPMWDTVKAAADYRAAKPDTGAEEVARLNGKIEAARKALS